jgi:hypothetical protein
MQTTKYNPLQRSALVWAPSLPVRRSIHEAGMKPAQTAFAVENAVSLNTGSPSRAPLGTRSTAGPGLSV